MIDYILSVCLRKRWQPQLRGGSHFLTLEKRACSPASLVVVVGPWKLHATGMTGGGGMRCQKFLRMFHRFRVEWSSSARIFMSRKTEREKKKSWMRAVREGINKKMGIRRRRRDTNFEEREEWEIDIKEKRRWKNPRRMTLDINVTAANSICATASPALVPAAPFSLFPPLAFWAYATRQGKKEWRRRRHGHE